MATSADDLLKQTLELDAPERPRLVTELLSTLAPESATQSLSDSEWFDAPGGRTPYSAGSRG